MQFSRFPRAFGTANYLIAPLLSGDLTIFARDRFTARIMRDDVVLADIVAWADGSCSTVLQGGAVITHSKTQVDLACA